MSVLGVWSAAIRSVCGRLVCGLLIVAGTSGCTAPPRPVLPVVDGGTPPTDLRAPTDGGELPEPDVQPLPCGLQALRTGTTEAPRVRSRRLLAEAQALRTAGRALAEPTFSEEEAQPQAPQRSGPAHLDERAQRLLRQALGCATEAMQLDRTALSARRERGLAWLALAAYDLAADELELAAVLDATDVENLRAVAELMIRHLSTRTTRMEIGRAYVAKANRLLDGQGTDEEPKRSKAEPITRAQKNRLRAELTFLDGLALRELGRSTEAKRAFEASLRFQESNDTRLEYLAAMFERCELEQVADAVPQLLLRRLTQRQRGWAHHYLGLALEMLGRTAEAQVALRRGRALLPGVLVDDLAVGPAEFAGMVEAAKHSLPLDEQALLVEVKLELADLPRRADLVVEDPPLSPTIVGLFRGLPRGVLDAEPRSIVLYRLNLLRMTRDRQELQHEIRTTLRHEILHFLGADEGDVRDVGME